MRDFLQYGAHERRGSAWCERHRMRPWARWALWGLAIVPLIAAALLFTRAWGNALDQVPGHGAWSPEALAGMARQTDLHEAARRQERWLEGLEQKSRAEEAYLVELHEQIRAGKRRLPTEIADGLSAPPEAWANSHHTDGPVVDR